MQLMVSSPQHSKELFETSRKKRNSFKSHFGFGKSKRKTHIGSPADANESASNSPVTEMFKRAHEEEVKQGRLVNDLVAKVEEFKHKVNCWSRYRNVQ